MCAARLQESRFFNSEVLSVDVKVNHMLVFLAYRREFAWHTYRRLDFSMFNRVLAVGLKVNHMLVFVAYRRECAWHMYRRVDFSMFNRVLAVGLNLNHMISVHIDLQFIYSIPFEPKLIH
jgi:hypothetical protein